MPLNRLDEERAHARRMAIASLSRYKFMMFGYWAAVWVHLNRLAPTKQGNPFKDLVLAARRLDREPEQGGQ